MTTPTADTVLAEARKALAHHEEQAAHHAAEAAKLRRILEAAEQPVSVAPAAPPVFVPYPAPAPGLPWWIELLPPQINPPVIVRPNTAPWPGHPQPYIGDFPCGGSQTPTLDTIIKAGLLS